MEIIVPHAKLMYYPPYAVECIEWAARKCYQTQPKREPGALIHDLLASGHLSPFEHISATFEVVCDRGISHEWVRHRIAAYSQESTRFCNYSKGRFGQRIKVIQPPFTKPTSAARWEDAIKAIEDAYLLMTLDGETVQMARSVLPTSLKTELAITFDLREWMWFQDVRWYGLTGQPHPQMLELSGQVNEQLARWLPCVFGPETVKTRWTGQMERMKAALMKLEEECEVKP